MEAGRVLAERFPFLAGSARPGRRRPRRAHPELPPLEFDESALQDALLYEAGEAEKAMREKRESAADEQLDVALAARLERPTQWHALDRETGRQFFVETENGRPSAIQFREPYEVEAEDEQGNPVTQTCLERYVRKIDVSGERPIPTWERRDLLFVFEGGELHGHRDMPPETLSPDEKHDLANVISRSVIQGTISR